MTMLIIDFNEIYAKPRNSFKACIKNKLGDMESFNVRKIIHCFLFPLLRLNYIYILTNINNFLRNIDIID